MKPKTLFITAFLSTSLVAPCLGQASFSLRPFTTGDTTIQWDVTGSMSGGGVLTATTTTTAPNNAPPNNGFIDAQGGSQATFATNEGPPRNVVFSFTGNNSATGINTIITNRLQSLAGANVFTFSQSGTVTENQNNSFFEDPGLTTPYSVGDAVGAVYSNNSTNNFRFTSAQLGTMSFSGGSPALTFNGSVSFDIIPEPSGIALLGLGSFAFVFRRRR